VFNDDEGFEVLFVELLGTWVNFYEWGFEIVWDEI
jgi:hypothetical protein